MRHGRELLLLVDEAEVLIEIGQTESAWLAPAQGDAGRQPAPSSPPAAADAAHRPERKLDDQPLLVRLPHGQFVDAAREGRRRWCAKPSQRNPCRRMRRWSRRSLDYTNSHPYLVQYLCQRLFAPGAKDGRLQACPGRRPGSGPDAGELFPAGLPPPERDRTPYFAGGRRGGTLDEDGIRARLADCADVRLISLLHALEELGHLRRCDEGWAAGSEFLLRWLQDNSRQLAEELAQ